MYRKWFYNEMGDGDPNDEKNSNGDDDGIADDDEPELEETEASSDHGDYYDYNDYEDGDPLI